MSNTAVHAQTLIKSGYYINKNFDIVPYDTKANKKVILITIDDGPSKNSKSMVDTLKKHNAHAIFFINGLHDKNYAGNILYEFSNGFDIGNHTWSHINLKKSKKDLIVKEIDKNTALINKITGQNPRFFRPPYGVITSLSKDIVIKDGMISMNWSGAAKDWEKSTKDETVFSNNVMKDLHPGEILLIHEHDWTNKYLDNLLTKIEQKGYIYADPKDIKE